MSYKSEVHHVNGIVFMVAKGGPIIFHELATGAVHVNLSKLCAREYVVQKALSIHRWYCSSPKGANRYVPWDNHSKIPTAINFWDSSIKAFEFEALQSVDSCLIYRMQE